MHLPNCLSISTDIKSQWTLITFNWCFLFLRVTVSGEDIGTVNHNSFSSVSISIFSESVSSFITTIATSFLIGYTQLHLMKILWAIKWFNSMSTRQELVIAEWLVNRVHCTSISTFSLSLFPKRFSRGLDSVDFP